MAMANALVVLFAGNGLDREKINVCLVVIMQLFVYPCVCSHTNHLHILRESVFVCVRVCVCMRQARSEGVELDKRICGVMQNTQN